MDRAMKKGQVGKNMELEIVQASNEQLYNVDKYEILHLGAFTVRFLSSV